MTPTVSEFESPTFFGHGFAGADRVGDVLEHRRGPTPVVREIITVTGVKPTPTILITAFIDAVTVHDIDMIGALAERFWS